MSTRRQHRLLRSGPPGIARHRSSMNVVGGSNRRRDEARRVGDLLRGTTYDGGESVVLPAEETLADRYRTTRNTVREALGLLRADGVLDRRRGVGTTMAPGVPGHDPSRLQGPRYFASGGAERVRYVNLFLAEVVSAPALAERLAVDPGEPVTLIERLTLLDGEVMAFRSAYIAVAIERVLAATEALQGDFWDLLEVIGRRSLQDSLTSVTVVRSDASSAPHLGVEVGSLLVLLESLTVADDGSPVSLSFLRVLPELFHLTFRSTRA